MRLGQVLGSSGVGGASLATSWKLTRSTARGPCPGPRNRRALIATRRRLDGTRGPATPHGVGVLGRSLGRGRGQGRRTEGRRGVSSLSSSSFSCSGSSPVAGVWSGSRPRRYNRAPGTLGQPVHRLGRNFPVLKLD